MSLPLSLSLSLRACVSCGRFSVVNFGLSVCMHVCTYVNSCISLFFLSVIIIMWFWFYGVRKETQQCLRKYFGNFCWDILVGTSKIFPLISLKSTFGKVFFLFLHFTFTSISLGFSCGQSNITFWDTSSAYLEHIGICICISINGLARQGWMNSPWITWQLVLACGVSCL